MTDTLISINPATGKTVGTVAVTALSDIDGIVANAKAAGKQWRQLSLEARGECLIKAAELMGSEAESLGRLISDEMGKLAKSGHSEANYCARSLKSKIASIIEALQPQVSHKGPIETAIYHDPLGVCAAISPWNYPLSMPQTMVIPALMAGNAVILKPSEETPLTGQAYADILNQFLPPNVLQVIHGNEEQGKALVKADVDLIAFTGSRAAGINIMSAASDKLKRIVLELGGKDPLIVLDDADIDAAAAMAVSNSFENAGQMCVSTERIYVHESIAPAFEAKVVELTQSVKIGPMVNERQRSHVIEQIKAAVAQGARILAGGTEHPERYITPTVLTGLRDDMDIMQGETFGPVACISYFSDIADAIERANASDYALGAAVFGKDQQRAYEVARQLTAGMTGVNRACFAPDDAPWVGAKQSGYGYHGSAAGHRQFAQLRVFTRQID